VRRALPCLGLLLLLAGCGREVRIGSGPAAPADRAPSVQIDGLEPGQAVSLRATWRSSDGARWVSVTRLRADGDGRAHAGAEVISGMGPARDDGSSFFPVVGHDRIDLRVLDGDRELARGVLRRDLLVPDVRMRELEPYASGGIAGTYFEPVRARGVAVLLLGGSEGGHRVLEPEAAQLAAAGHPTLVAGYFGDPGLPARLSHVPLETVHSDIAWLRAHGATHGRRPAIVGFSTGAELALLAAARDPSLTRRIVALSPPERIRVPWFVPGAKLRVGGLIPVERIRGRVLTAGGNRDVELFSGAYATEIAERINRRGGARAEAHVYDQAGHLAGVPLPYLPPEPTNLTGGTPQADEAARRDLWPRILRFLAG
jgi:uncharacterized protein